MIEFLNNTTAVDNLCTLLTAHQNGNTYTNLKLKRLKINNMIRETCETCLQRKWFWQVTWVYNGYELLTICDNCIKANNHD